MVHCSQRCQNLFTKTEASQTHLIPAVVLASTTFFSTNVVPGLGDKILLMEHEWLNNTMQWQHYEKENTQLVQSTGRKKKMPQGLETSGTKEVFKNSRVPNLLFSYQLNNKG